MEADNILLEEGLAQQRNILPLASMSLDPEIDPLYAAEHTIHV